MELSEKGIRSTMACLVRLELESNRVYESKLHVAGSQGIHIPNEQGTAQRHVASSRRRGEPTALIITSL